MRPYPDLVANGMHAMHFSFHVSGGLEAIDSFWEERGLDRSKERLLLAGYTRNGTPHTLYLNWARSHDQCCDIYLGIEARRPAQVWPRRKFKDHRLDAQDFQEFIKFVQEKERDVPWGIRARYTYPSSGPVTAPTKQPSKTRLRSISFDLLENDQTVAKLTYDRKGSQWFTIIEPMARYPFPKGKNFFQQPFELGRSLSPIMEQA